MAFQALDMDYRMQRTASLSRQVLERAKKRKLYWYPPSHHHSRIYRGEADVSLEAAFAAVVEHLACISEACEDYYCSVPPFQFEDREIEHIFRYHSKEASKNLLRAFEYEEKKNAPIVEEQNTPIVEEQNTPVVKEQNTPVVKKQNTPVVKKQNTPVVEEQNVSVVEKPERHKTKATVKIPAQPLEELLIEVSPGSYIINTSSFDDTIKEAHLVNVQPGESVNVVFHLPPPNKDN